LRGGLRVARAAGARVLFFVVFVVLDAMPPNLRKVARGHKRRASAISRRRKRTRRGGAGRRRRHARRVADGRAPRRGTGLAAVVGLLTSLAAPRACAWATVEHQEIGRWSYLQACAQLARTLSAAGTPAQAGAAARMERVCGRNREVMAHVYGDGTAIAGDFLGHPSEFVSQAGAWRFSSKKHYYLLALENSAHFNPTATRSWAEYHLAALAFALSAAAARGLASLEQLQSAFFENAFADHYLHDSFAAGHMGFNRAASSAAAAKAFHDAWNERGRVVTDRAGTRWRTYGDGRLDQPANAEGRAHVLEAATLSVRGLLAAFVLGAAATEDDTAVWQLLPFTIEAPEVKVEMEAAFTGSGTGESPQVPLQLAIRPAAKDLVTAATVWTAAPFEETSAALVALTGGVELRLPVIPAQTYLGAGGTLRAPGEPAAAVLETGVVVPLMLSASGLISHQLDATASWILRTRFAAVIHAEYQGNLELGDLLLSAHAGLAEIFPAARAGFYAGLGVGVVFTAAGGGAL
jgi:hypothetical protein